MRSAPGFVAVAAAVLASAPLVQPTSATAPPTEPAVDDCIAAEEPNDEAADAQVLPATEVCVTSEHEAGGQDLFTWTVGEAESALPWTITMGPTPDQAVTVQVHRVQLDDSGAVFESEQLATANAGPGAAAALTNLLFPPGEYLLGVSTSGPAPYELSVVPGAPSPDATEEEPNDSTEQATPVAGAFSVAGDRAGSIDWFAWELDEAAASQLWDVHLQLPVLATGSVHLTTDDGVQLFAGGVDVQGTLTLSDVGLDAGRYLLGVDGAGADQAAPYILQASTGGEPGEGLEREPNDTFAAGMPVSAAPGATVLNGRLATVTDRTDYDVFRLTVDDASAGRQIDVKLFWRGGSDRRLCLLDGEGRELQCGDGDHSVAFNDVVLAAGDYGVQVSGVAAPDDPYLLRFDVTAEATSGFEAEPNDVTARATPFDVSGERPVGSGRLDGPGNAPDRDVFQFTVTGEPQLWQVTATGPGVTGLDSLDAVGATGMSADPVDGTATLYDVFLLPGDRWFRVEGDGGDYTVEAEPLGPPDPQAEHEPNDTFDYSQPVRLGEERTGRLVQINDIDVYRFSLQNDGHVVIDVDAPADAQVGMSLSQVGSDAIAQVGAAAPGDDLTYDAILPPGDFVLSLYPATPSEETYTVVIAPTDPFTVAVDAEPNDTAVAARPMPDSLVVSGTIDPTYRYGDVDWFVIPPQDEAGTATFEVSGDGASIELLVPANADQAETPIVPLAGASAGVYSADLPAGTPVMLSVYGTGDYEVAMTPSTGPPTVDDVPDELEVDVDVASCDQAIAAYWTDSQRIECELLLTNGGEDPVELALDSAVGHYAWTVAFDEDSVSLDTGATTSVPVTIVAAPDAWADRPVVVTVRAREAGRDDGRASTGSVTIIPDRSAPPLNPVAHEPLPAELLGGLDVAWTGLGAAPVAIDEATATQEAVLYDQLTPVGFGWSRDATSLPLELTVDLAGDDPVPVAGIVLNPQGAPAERLRGFELELSLDGQTFTSALSGELSPVLVDQPFVMPEPVEARFARLRVLSAQRPTAGLVWLAEWAVVAAPGWTLDVGGAALDLADPAHGGHVVDARPSTTDYAQWNDVVVDDGVRQTVSPTDGLPSWVIGFHHDRAAQVTGIEWTDPPGSDPGVTILEVAVDISVDGPAGPWSPVGTWALDRGGGGTARFTFDEPAWARFVRVTATATSAAEGSAVEVPGVIRVFERPADDAYRSILGEWGHDQREAIYEFLDPPEPIVLDPDAGDDRGDATSLTLGTTVTESAWVGQDEDWYVIDVPAGERALAITLSGLPTIDVDIEVYDAGGTEVAIEADDLLATELTLVAEVESGGQYFVRITEPPSSVVFGFDTSMSIGPYTAAVLQGLVRYTGDVEQGQETVNVIPFGAQLLLDEWADEPYLLQAAITNYPQTATSSDAEGALVVSLGELATQPGVKAVVLITDAQNMANPDLWPMLAAVQPQIFAVHLAGGTPLDQDLMEDWAAVNDGLYTYVRSQGDIDVAFDRAATILRRPSLYRLHAETTEPPPPPSTTTSTTTTSTTTTSTSTTSTTTSTTPPTTTTSTTTTSTTTSTTSTTFAPMPTVVPDGFLSVLPSPPQAGLPLPVAGDATVALILDTSGSMLQGLGDGRRIDAARGALTALVTQTIPAGTNVSLRVFGDAPDSCDTRLLVPQSPLDPGAMTGVIANVPVIDGVRTPIGASLQQVAGDLGTGAGPKIVVLVTDGEETCDGDPAAAIQSLIDSGIDVRVNIVGFALDDEALKAQFQEWARLGNGQYIDAGNQAELTAAVAAAVQPTFAVFDSGGAAIAGGQVGGDPVPVPPGTYVLEIRTATPQRYTVEIVSGQPTIVQLP